jgi:hypothetical protein
VIVVFTLNLVFNHWTRRPKGESAVSVAVREGAVAVDVPDDGVVEHGEVETERVELKA